MTKLGKRNWILVSLLAGVFAWAYWPIFGELAEKWSSSTLYSHGYLVPAFAVFLLWHHRATMPEGGCEPSWWGPPCVLVGVILHLTGAYFYYDWASHLSILPFLVGACLSVGGRKWLRWSWPAIAFLFFMIPLPFRVEQALGGPLQHLATVASTYLLQTLGFAAISEGNIIVTEQSRLGVAEACSGLGMLVTFFALAGAVAILWRGPLIDRFVIVLSALPIAVVANVLRITLTGICAETVGHGIADVIFHDLAGWIMMPMALGMLWIEIRILDTLFITVRSEDAVAAFSGEAPASLPSTVRGEKDDRFHQAGLATPGGIRSRRSVPR